MGKLVLRLFPKLREAVEKYEKWEGIIEALETDWHRIDNLPTGVKHTSPPVVTRIKGARLENVSTWRWLD